MFEACLQHPCHLNINPCPNTQACTYVYLLGPQITRDTYVHKSTCQGHIGTHMITLPWSFKAVALNRWQMMHSHTHTNICSFRGVCTCMQVNKNTHAIQLHSAHTHTHTHVFLFNISLKSLHIPKLTPACPTYSHIPLPSTYVQTLTCTQMVHMCNYPITPHMYTQTLMYTHLPTLVT